MAPSRQQQHHQSCTQKRRVLLEIDPFVQALRKIRDISAVVHHYHEERPHQGLDNEVIAPKATSLRHGHVRRRERLGGVLKLYHREAA